MRYYGMSSGGQAAPVLDAEEKRPVSPTNNQPTTPAQMPEQDRTFNRPQNQTGIYNGQLAQNVTEVMPNALYENQQSPTVYQYPAGQTPPQNSFKCEVETEFKNHLCSHLGDYLYIELIHGGEKNGMLSSVGENFLTLRDGANHIMCPLMAINSITVYNYSK